ncbi:MAG: nucleotidyltransferase domain-containing protein [Chthoniobacter sp.]|nr:nucleotidyltransferase domain-containing protein [Chthoniobacter sp.]
MSIETRINAALARIEREENVEVLFAVESGSRAWGFPSRDSDFDVRFVFRRPIVDYLAVIPRRDVIETPIDGALDINGWDVRKALALLVRSNAALLEWLASPVRYRDNGALTRLADLARRTADLAALAYHYDHQARRSHAAILAGHDVQLKSYCYALRPALALLWLREQEEVPPMDVPSLMVGLKLQGRVPEAVADLLARKAVATERDTTARIPVLDAFISDCLASPPRSAPPIDRSVVTAQADALFASLVLERDTSQPSDRNCR